MLMEAYKLWVLLLTLVIALACIALTDAGKGVRPSWIASLLAYVPSACQLACMILGLDPKRLALAAIADPLPGIRVLLTIAVLNAVFGIIVDVPLSVVLYHLRTGDRSKMSWHDIQMTAKYGSPDEYVPGQGRYHLKPWHMLYATGCNVLGALCGSSLLMFMHSLGPDFIAYAAQRPILFELVGPAFAASLFLVYGDLYSKQRYVIVTNSDGSLPDGPLSLDEIDTERENPDVYLLDRAHVLFNALCIMATTTLLFFFGGLVIGYVTESWGHLQMNEFYPILTAASCAFVWFAAASPLAVRSKSRAAPMHMTGQCAIAVGFSVFSLAFIPSVTTLWVFATAVAAVVVGFRCRPMFGERGWTAALPLVVTFAIVAFGLVCSIVS